MFLYTTILENSNKRIIAEYDSNKHEINIFKYDHCTCGKYTHSIHLMKVKDMTQVSSNSLNAEHIIFMHDTITDDEFSAVYIWSIKLFDTTIKMIRNLQKVDLTC